MKIEELSVGDWVLCDGEYWKISAIHEYSVGLYCDSDYSDALLEECDPIPLTPEILEKNGFERKQYNIEYTEDGQEIEYDGYRHILCKDGVQYDIILVDSCGGYFDLEIESGHRDEAVERILISSRLSLDYVEFVHQLQHAFRLAGIEKEIEL